MRTIRNSITDLYVDDLLGHGPEDFAQEVIAKEGDSPVLRFSTSSPLRNTEGDLEALALYSGQICGMVDRIRPAGQIVQEMVDDARQTLMRICRIDENP